MPTLAQLPKLIRDNVLLAANDKDVQRLITEAAFECIDNQATTIDDLMDYISPEEISNPEVREAMVGDEEDEEDIFSPAVCDNVDAMEVLIQQVKDKVIQKLKGE